MAEQRFVEPPVEGSSPSGHPNTPVPMDTRGMMRGLPDPPTSGPFSPSDGPERDLEEAQMNAFLVELENKPGELARVTEAIAAKGVDISGVSGSTCGSSGSVALMTDNDATTRSALEEARVTFREMEATPAAIGMAPGSLAKACRRLADGGVNVEALMPTGMEGDHVTVAFITSDAAKARQILSQAGTTAG
jgi:hypothetical protein